MAVGDADFPRTRLTHSLECAQIGRGIGAAIGCDPDLVETACLAHDIGHPPFGHNGEMALADLAAGCGGFEGNAQTLRLLTRLETKVRGAGLNLTRASLDATLKYPWPAPPRGAAAPMTRSISEAPAPPKFNYYADDAAVFDWIRLGAPARRRCLEAQVMDWADDVAYSVHDVEDGLHAGLITLAQLGDSAERDVVALVAQRFYAEPGDASAAELRAVFDDLMALDCWPKSFDGGPDALAALKNLTSELVGRFCVAAQEATRAACDGHATPGAFTIPATPATPSTSTTPVPSATPVRIPPHPSPSTTPVPSAAPATPGGERADGRRGSGAAGGHGAADGLPAVAGPRLTRYACDLAVPRIQRLECALLKAVAAHYVMTRAGAAAAQARERELIAELAATVQIGAPRTLDPVFRPAWDAAPSDAARRRVVIDQIASLTDTSAIAWHRRLCRAPTSP